MLQTVIEPTEKSWTSRWVRGLPYRRENPHWWRIPPSRTTRFDSMKSSIALALLTAGGWFLVTQGILTGPRLMSLVVGLALLAVAWWWTTLFGHRHLPTRLTAAGTAQALRDKTWTGTKATRGERKTAEQIAEQGGEDGFRVSIRALTIGQTEGAAREQQDQLKQQFRAAFHDNHTGQRLTLRPIRSKKLIARGVKRLAARKRTATRRREWAKKLMFAPRRQVPMILKKAEVAALGHLPDSSVVRTNKIRWSTSRAGVGVPIGMPRFDFKARGLANATQAEKQLAMFDASEKGQPLWYGWGAKMDTEAGLIPHNLDAHQFVGGATRVGKSTFLINFASQAIFRRGSGGIIFDPKGKDADDFIREWPDDRPEEDLIIMDLGEDPDGNEYEKMPRFNLLEMPDGGGGGFRDRDYC